jgi:hypothetical protein
VQHEENQDQEKKEKASDSMLWLAVIAWMALSFGVLLQFEPPRWSASYCQARP